LSKIRKITENGVIFRSPRDGQTIDLTPERSIEIQNALGADVIMAFDECPPYPREEIQAQLLGTYRWLERCIALISGLTKHCLGAGGVLDCAPMLQSLAKQSAWVCNWRCECGEPRTDCQNC